MGSINFVLLENGLPELLNLGCFLFADKGVTFFSNFKRVVVIQSSSPKLSTSVF